MGLAPGYRACVLGASGAIGGALARAIADDRDCAALFALSRSAAAVSGATAIAADVTDEASLGRAATTIGSLDAVIVASGILHGEGITPERRLRDVDGEALATLFAVNTTGPLLAFKHFVPLLPRDRRSIVAALGARVGSIGDNRLGGWYGYRASKAALAMSVRCLAIELARSHRQAIALLLHPGTVTSALSAPFSGARVTPDESARHLLGVLARASPTDSGAHIAWDGAIIPA